MALQRRLCAAWRFWLVFLYVAQAGSPQAKEHGRPVLRGQASRSARVSQSGTGRSMSRDVTGNAWGAPIPEPRMQGDYTDIYDAMKRHIKSAAAHGAEGTAPASGSLSDASPAEGRSTAAAAALVGGAHKTPALRSEAPREDGESVTVASSTNASSTGLSQPVAANVAKHGQAKNTSSGRGLAAAGNSPVPPPVVQLNANGNVEPRIFFLFMTKQGIEREDLWTEFFKNAKVSQYRLIEHCVEGETCGLASALNTAKGRPGLDVKVIDSVASVYCKDLVTPMAALLAAALAESVGPQDKFVFLSESTLPVKNFDQVYGALTASPSSDFCIYRADRWPDFQMNPNGGMFEHDSLVKHSQWVVLNKEHAQKMTERWPTVNTGQNTFWSLPIWFAKDGYDQGRWSTVRESDVCTDEWAIFASIFGVVKYGPQDQKISVPGISLAKPPTLWLQGTYGQLDQGVCRTFASWGLSSAQNAFATLTHMMNTPDATKLTCWPHCASSSPIEFLGISDQDLATLKSSDFLFARKFHKDAVTLDQFRRLVL